MKYNVEPKVLLERIHEEYLMARKPIFISEKNKGINIKRGKSRNTPEIAEDLVADYIRLNLECIDDAFVFTNQPLSIYNQRQPTYPDIAVCKKVGDKKFEIRYIIDVKTDAGHLGGNVEWLCDKHDKEIQFICQNKIKYGIDGEDKNIKYQFEINESKICYDIVIISANNKGNTQAFKEKIQQANTKQRKTDMRVLRLLSKGHLNDYKKEEYEINYPDFEQMITRARESLK